MSGWTVHFRDHEGSGDPALVWDTTFDPTVADLAFDWAIAPQDGSPDSGGLTARAGIATAVILSLFTDARAPDGWRPEERDRRGWWGDGLAGAGTEPFGSWLWTVVEQGVVNEAAARAAEREAARALAWMVRDGVAARVDVVATADPPARRLDLAVAIRARSGETTFDQTFALLWDRVSR